MQQFFTTRHRGLIIACVVVLMAACTQRTPETKTITEPGRPLFEPIAGTDFFEVRRSFDNGLAFDTIGFEQEPQWHVNFVTNDSVLIYSPDSGAMLGYSIYYDHDSIFHFGREWFRVRSLERDSLLLQRLTVQNLRVKEARSNVYMKLYSARYIRDSLKTTVEELRKPRRNDTLFIQWKADRANRNPANIDSAFSARRPVQLTSKNPNISVKRKELDEAESINKSAAYAYLYPEFRIDINSAYKDFSHTFSVLVDDKGNMHLGKFNVMPEFEESRRKVLEGIIEGYLKNWLDIRPGTTLGIPHTSLILLNVRGKT